MKRSFRVWATVAITTIALTAGACGKKPPAAPAPPPAPAPAPPAPEPTKPTPPPAPAPPPPAPKTPTEDEVFAAMSLDDLNKKGVLGDTFFALDSTELTQESRGAVQKNSEYMKRWKTTKVLVEGHADSRGTNEYNLALADRRAAAVRDYLVSLGITADRVTVVSKGEEAPFCTEEAESCWQQNRRGHFIFTAK
ncbi:MAG TPA: OmpA family protein [Vicinamibacterales bacterium]|nr:OmpA family protein [Vicinamibacterales bacterium]